jgi:hypothetical protein
MNKEVINQRIEQLKAQEANLQLQLDEIRYLVQGYENTLTQTEQSNEPELS